MENKLVRERGHKLEEVTHYYPFGDVYGDAGLNLSAQPYKYNGKELDRMYRLDWYDYGARSYDAVVSMWTSVDPMAEKYYNVSPYIYCLNNPIRLIDPNGKDPGDMFPSIWKVVYDFSMKYNEKSIKQNVEYSTVIYSTKKREKTMYSYTEPSNGSIDRSNIKDTDVPNNSTIQASAHTHGAYDHDYNNDEFSGDVHNSKENLEVTYSKDNITDIGAYNKEQIDGYLITPSGSMLKYDHNNGYITRSRVKVTCDPNDPNRGNNQQYPTKSLMEKINIWLDNNLPHL